jgi:hypothetical protein
LGTLNEASCFARKKQRKGSLVFLRSPAYNPFHAVPQGGTEAALKHKEKFMTNTYRIRQCPRILLTSDRQPPVETCRMLRQEFGFDWNKRGTSGSSSPVSSR